MCLCVYGESKRDKERGRVTNDGRMTQGLIWKFLNDPFTEVSETWY